MREMRIGVRIAGVHEAIRRTYLRVAQTRQAASGLHEMLFAGCKNMSTLVRMFGVLYRVSTSELDALSPSQKRNPIPLAENGISF